MAFFKGRGRWRKAALTAAVLLLVAGAVAAYLRWPPLPGDLRKVSADALGNTPGNIANGGIAVQAGEEVYYCDPEAGGIFRAVPGGAPVLLCEDSARSLNVVGDWICYANADDDSRIYRIKRDGTGREKISDLHCSEMLAAGSWLYVSCWVDGGGFSLRRVRADGKRVEELSKNEVDSMMFVDGQLYARMYGRLYVFKDKPTRITAQGEEDTKMRSMLIEDGWVYYASNERSLYKMRLDGSENTQLLGEGEVTWLNMDENWLYYANGADRYKMYRVRRDGTGKEKVSDDRADSYGINLVKDVGYCSCNLYRLERMNPDGSDPAILLEEYAFRLAASGEWLYYGDATYGMDTPLYKVRLDGTEKTLLDEDDCNGYLVIGDWIYYSGGGAFGPLHKIKSDGSGKTRLGSLEMHDFVADGGWLYYTTYSSWTEAGNGRLIRVRTDGTGEEQIARKVAQVAARDGRLYYRENDERALFAFQPLEKPTLLLEDSVRDFIVTDQAIFYSGESGVFQTALDGTGRSALLQLAEGARAEKMAFADGWLYFMKNPGLALHRLNPQTGETQRLSDKEVYSYVVHEGKLYCTTVETPFVRIDLNNLRKL